MSYITVSRYHRFVCLGVTDLFSSFICVQNCKSMFLLWSYKWWFCYFPDPFFLLLKKYLGGETLYSRIPNSKEEKSYKISDQPKGEKLFSMIPSIFFSIIPTFNDPCSQGSLLINDPCIWPYVWPFWKLMPKGEKYQSFNAKGGDTCLCKGGDIIKEERRISKLMLI